MDGVPQHTLTAAEYLEVERGSLETRHEYLDGEAFAMAGASEPDNMIVTNLVIGLGTYFKGRPCRVYASDMRVRTRHDGLYAYPDVVALCGEPVFADEQRDTLTNPQVICEVLSESTEASSFITTATSSPSAITSYFRRATFTLNTSCVKAPRSGCSAN